MSDESVKIVITGHSQAFLVVHFQHIVIQPDNDEANCLFWRNALKHPGCAIPVRWTHLTDHNNLGEIMLYISQISLQVIERDARNIKPSLPPCLTFYPFIQHRTRIDDEEVFSDFFFIVILVNLY